jgi:hypothetical protein
MENAAPQDLIDPNVKVPAAVRAAAARSEELAKQQIAPEADSAPPVETRPVEEAAAPDVKMSAEPPSPQVKKTPDPVTKPSATISEESWEHRYNSMKGRYEKDTKRLSDDIANLHRLLAEMQTAQAAPAQSDVRFERLVTPEEEQDYGSELLGVVGRKAKEELTPEIKALKSQIAQLQGQLQGVAQQSQLSAREKMYQSLDDQVPNWRDLNSDPEFLSWLNLPDMYSGAIRKELLNAAYQRSDAARVAAFFKGFIADEAATNPVGQVSERPAVENSKRPSLESLAAPGRAKTAAASAPVEKPYFTRAEISKFFSEVNRGVYRGRDEEKGRIEKQIFDAQREGRIRS